jgi:hypothetical protein
MTLEKMQIETRRENMGKESEYDISKLTQSEIKRAKELGVTLEEYAEMLYITSLNWEIEQHHLGYDWKNITRNSDRFKRKK